MNTPKELVMYSRTTGCPFVSLAKRVLSEQQVTYRELFIDEDEVYKQRVLTWTGFLSVPTLIVANQGEDLPYDDPAPLEPGTSPRGVDRGTMITEPGMEQLREWLGQHHFILQENAFQENAFQENAFQENALQENAHEDKIG